MTDSVAPQGHSGELVAVSPMVDSDLRSLVAAWLLTVDSEHSRLAYATDLGLRYEHGGGAYRLSRRGGGKGWLDHLDRLGVPPLAADEVHVNLWRDHLRESYAASSVARKLVAVSSFYRYLVRRRVLPRNPAEFATRPKVNRDRTVTFSPSLDQLGPILDAAWARDPRTCALVHLMLFTGVRVSEAVGADVEDLRTQAGQTALTVTRKGGEVAEVPVPAPAVEALREYLGSRSTGPLFLARGGVRLTRSRARDLVKSVGVRSGVTDQLTPHSLRHAYANGAESSKVPVTQIQHDLGHRSLATTQGYLHAGRRHQDFGGHALAARLARKKAS